MEKGRLFAVLTGDIVKSTDIPAKEHKLLPEKLKGKFQEVNRNFPNVIETKFQIYRGDSFQGVLSKPELSLTITIFLKALLKLVKFDNRRGLDARIAVGIGNIDYLPDSGSSEGNGEAFRQSGAVLDNMKKKKRKLEVWTPHKEVNKELNTEFEFLDFIIEGWSKVQSETIIEKLKGFTQKEIARKFNISQPAVHKRLKSAGSRPIEKLMKRYKELVLRL